MLAIKKTGTVQGNQKSYGKYITNELQDKLDGMLLGDAQEKGLIMAEKFEEVITTWVGDNSGSASRIELVTDMGNIIVSSTLAEELADWANRLGDLVFKKAISDKKQGYTGKEYFRLQRPGGGIKSVRTDLSIGQVTAEEAGA